MIYLFENNHLLVLGQFILAAGVVGTWLYLFATGSTPPETLTTVVTVVIGFFFGAQVNEMLHRGA